MGRKPSASDDDEARMSLVDHLRELRSRLGKAVLGVVLAMIAAYIFYDPIFHLISDPYTTVAQDLRSHGINVELVIIGSVTSPFVLQLKVAAYAGIIAASPIWLYQLWAFVIPGLHRNERKYALGFLSAAVPLFLAGVALCYWALPKGIGILLEFTPQGFSTLTTLEEYLDFVLRMMLIFGIGFVLPVFVVVLNAIGVLPAAALCRVRAWVIVGIFLFAAIATPTGDPFNMCLVALPITALYLIAETVCRIRDRRKAREVGSEPDFSDLDDDTSSPLDLTRSRSTDDRPSRLDDDTT